MADVRPRPRVRASRRATAPNADVNAFFSNVAGQPRDAMRNQIHDYMNANPTVTSDLRGIRQPMKDLRNRCGPFFAKT